MKYLLYIALLLTVASSATAKEYFKFTDPNGLEYWLDDKSKIPPPLPIYFRYEDYLGTPTWVNTIDNIPSIYRNQNVKAKDDVGKSVTIQNKNDKKQYSTRISIVNNVIIVPVIFRNKGHKVKAKMILDTGASVTTVYSGLAAKLHLKKNKRSKVKRINATGVSSNGVLTKVDHIEIDNLIHTNTEVIVIPSRSKIGADGLLGNSFLRFFNFTIDYDKQLLRWN